MPATLIERTKLIPVLLVDGPCAGRWEHVAVFGDESWVRVGQAGIDRQMWARYSHNPVARGEYLYSGAMLTTQELGESLKRHEDAGNTIGEAYGG